MGAGRNGADGKGGSPAGKARRLSPAEERRGYFDEGAQVSAEMLIIIAALIAVAIVLIGQLQSSAKTGAKNLEAKNAAAWKEIEKIG